MVRTKYALLLFVIIMSSFLMINATEALPDLAIEKVTVMPSHPPANGEVYILLTVKNRGSSKVPAANEEGQFNFGIKEIKYLDDKTVVVLSQSARSGLADSFAVDETKILVIKWTVTKSQNISLCVDCTNSIGEMDQYPNEAIVTVYLANDDPKNERCVKGETICSDSYIWTCNSVLKTLFDRSDQPCTYGCDEDLATGRLAMCKICNDSDQELKCVDSNLKKCGPFGRSWEANKTCEYGCNSTSLTCKPKPESPICTAGEKRCNTDGNLETCGADRYAWVTTNCTNGCKDKACIVINYAPTELNITPRNKTTLTVGENFLFTAIAKDPENDALTYEWDLGIRNEPWGYITIDENEKIICEGAGTKECSWEASTYIGEITADLGNPCTCEKDMYPKQKGKSFLYAYKDVYACSEAGKPKTNKCKITVTATDRANNSVSGSVMITLKEYIAPNPCAAYSNSHACSANETNKLSGTNCCCGAGFKPLVNSLTSEKQCSELTCSDKYPNTHSCSANETNKLSGVDCCCNAGYNVLAATSIGAIAGQLQNCVPAGCTNDSQCETGEVCVNNICKSTKCEYDSDCGYFEVCQNSTCIKAELNLGEGEREGEEGAGLEEEEALEGEEEKELCGDAYCDLTLGENAINCIKDCHCGDKVCQQEYYETANTCPGDCKKTPVTLIVVLILIFIGGVGFYLAYAKGMFEKKGGKDTSENQDFDSFPRAFSEAEGGIEPPAALAVKHNVNTPSDSTVSLRNYIKASRAQGFSYTQIKSSLLKKGWTEEKINKMFGEMA